VRELANRYSDSPAFKGVALRYMGWQFPAWQGFPSIDWGYGDWTINKFEEETDVDVPVNDDDPNRYRKRYDWLMANAYQEWVDWRCARLTAYLNELASILRDARSDLKLRLDLHGPTYGDEPDAEAYRLKGWEGLLRETGLDPERLRKNPDIVMVEGRVYPPGIRGAGTKEPVERGERIFTNFDGAATRDLASPLGEGSINAAHIDANSFESNIARMKDLGYEGLKGRGNRPAEIHGAGLVFPAGRHSLRRYATAMASGNITEFTDGSHGYICWPTEHLKEWMLEYQALPDIGMKKLDGSGDPVAVWYGMKKGNTFLYAVNTSPWKASVSITLPAGASLDRLTTGEELLSGEDGKMRFSLEAYELRGFRAGASPTGMNADIPKEVKNKLHKQLDFIDGLLNGEFGGGGSGVFPISPVELRHAGERLAEAREAFEKGHYWRVRLLTLHWDLLRLYDAFNAWPEGVWDRRLPVEPEGAMNAETLRQRISGRRSEASVLTGSSIHPWLGGSKVLQVTEPVDVKVSLPVYNRYQLRYACVLADHDWPGLKIDEKEIPQTSVSEKKTDILAIQTMSPPLSLRKGEHTLNIRPGRKPAGILWAYFQPVFRPLRANDWLVLGSFDSEWENPGPPKLDLKLPPDAGAINFDETYTGKDGKEIGWQRPESESEYIDLYKVTTDYSFVLGYAVTHIISPEKRLAEFHFGVDYWAQVFLNNEKVYEAAEGHGAPTAGQFRFTAELREGINELKIKVHAGSRGNGFWLGVSDPGDLEVRVPDMDRNPLMPTRENLIGDKSSGV
jgi:hypothetical protein